MAQKKQNFRDELRDYAARKSGGVFDQFNDFQRSQWMTKAYLELILGIMNPGLIPEDDEDFASSFADAPSDAGVDFLVRSDGHVLIIQAKYHKYGRVESDAEFEHLCDVLSRLHPVLGRKYKVSARLAKPKWLDQTLGPNAEVKRYTRLACEDLVKIYKAAAKSSEFTHRNWFRTRDTLKDIISELQYSTTILDTLNHLSRDSAAEQ